MLEAETGYVDRVFPDDMLWDYRMSHPRTRFRGKYDMVMCSLRGVYNLVWCSNRNKVGYFDYKRALRINSTNDDTESDEDEDTTFDDVESLYPTRADVANFGHPIGPNMAEYSDTSSDETDSDSDSSSSSDSDTPIIAVSRRDPSIRVEVHRIRRVTDSDDERDRLHAEYLSAD